MRPTPPQASLENSTDGDLRTSICRRLRHSEPNSRASSDGCDSLVEEHEVESPLLNQPTTKLSGTFPEKDGTFLCELRWVKKPAKITVLRLL
jgi:hypothetical protein